MQLIKPIVTKHALEIFEDVVLNVGRPVSDLRITAIAIVVECERSKTLFAVGIVNETSDMRPAPLRPEVDQTFEIRRITDVVKIGRLQNVLDRMVTRANFRTLNSIANFQFRNRNESDMPAKRDVSAEVGIIIEIKHA